MNTYAYIYIHMYNTHMHIYAQNTPVYIWQNCDTNNNFNNNLNDNQVKQALLDIYRRHQI